MKLSTIPALLTTFSIIALGAPMPAQIGIQPKQASSTEESGQDPKTRDLKDLMADLRTQDAWWDTASALTNLARSQQMAVLTELSSLTRTSSDKSVASRGRAVIAQIIAEHSATEKRGELRGRFRKLDDAMADLKKAAESGKSGATNKAIAAAQAAMESLRESVDADDVLNPVPLRVPMGRRGNSPQAPAPAPSQDQAPMPDQDGYRRIEVDGKEFLVPKSSLPDGTEFKAEFVNGSLVIRRYPEGPKKGDADKGKPKEKGPQKEASKEPHDQNGDSR